jgi:hypothetical protein
VATITGDHNSGYESNTDEDTDEEEQYEDYNDIEKTHSSSTPTLPAIC